MSRRLSTIVVPVAVLIGALGLAACAPAGSGGGGGGTSSTTASTSSTTTTTAASGTRYVDQVFAGATPTTDVVYATAPDLRTGAPVPLALDVFQPSGDTATSRPAIVVVHGGGFRGGNRAQTDQFASDYARRGYVTFSIDYRLDPGNQCQAVQDGKITDPAQEATERARCQTAIFAAQHDTQAVVRWVKADASTYGVDTHDVAVAGFSAGAVTAVNVATRSDDPGDVGDHDSVDSRVAAALVASGCSYTPDSVGVGDAPLYLLHAELDQAVPFACAQDVAARATAAGVHVETAFYLGESTHAMSLYTKYQTATDAAWTAFLVAQLDLP